MSLCVALDLTLTVRPAEVTPRVARHARSPSPTAGARAGVSAQLCAVVGGDGASQLQAGVFLQHARRDFLRLRHRRSLRVRRETRIISLVRNNRYEAACLPPRTRCSGATWLGCGTSAENWSFPCPAPTQTPCCYRHEWYERKKMRGKLVNDMLLRLTYLLYTANTLMCSPGDGVPHIPI